MKSNAVQQKVTTDRGQCTTLPLARSVSEADLQRNVIALAQTLGWLVHAERPAQKKNGEWRTPVQGDKGFPDLVLVRAGQVLFIELKSEKGQLSPEQHRWMLELPYFRCYRPSDWLNGTIEEALK